jgi:hypothetical protein
MWFVTSLQLWSQHWWSVNILLSHGKEVEELVDCGEGVIDGILGCIGQFTLWVPRQWGIGEYRPLLHNTVLAEGQLNETPWLAHWDSDPFSWHYQPPNSCCQNAMQCLTENVLPIHHAAKTLHLATSTLSEHWRNTWKENISDMPTTWMLRCAGGCQHWDLIPPLQKSTCGVLLGHVSQSVCQLCG